MNSNKSNQSNNRVMKLLEFKFRALNAAFENFQGISNLSIQAEASTLERIYNIDGESYKYGSWDLSSENQAWVGNHDCAHKLESQSVSAIKNRHPAPSGGFFISNETNKIIKLSTQAAKDDKLLSEAEKHVLDLARTETYIEDVSKEFRNIIEPKELEIMLFVNEISGSSRDLVRLALHYTQKWKTSRRVSVCQSSGYDKDIATADPGSDTPEHQYLFHPSTLEKMEITRQSSRNDKMLRQALSSKSINNYPSQFHNQYQPSRRKTNYRGSSQPRWGCSSKWSQTEQNSNYRSSQGNGNQYTSSQKPQWNQGTNSSHASSSLKPAQPVGNRNTEKWVRNSIRTATIPYSKEDLQSSRDSPACYQLDGPEIFGLRDHQSSLGYKPSICLTNIWEGRTGKDTPAIGYDAYQRLRQTHSDNTEAHRETWIHYEPRKISYYSEKPSEIPRSSVRHPENVDSFDPGKKKENQKRSPQSHKPSGNGETSDGIKRHVFGSCKCNRACLNQVKRTSTRHNKRPKEAQIQLQRALPTFSIDTERSEVVGHPIKPLELVATEIEDLKPKRTRICYNRCF
ncbi:hypothetical protein AYI70_g4124 [Smittium culicis]|uniref:Uncharacterized protein n=1 Tax=Smittium culicis TaxID=133412 RepID=A0A1R1Y0V1_9FUNG|nr:hypothetical protein AYI70_g4124 [Smittium culicis]